MYGRHIYWWSWSYVPLVVFSSSVDAEGLLEIRQVCLVEREDAFLVPALSYGYGDSGLDFFESRSHPAWAVENTGCSEGLWLRNAPRLDGGPSSFDNPYAVFVPFKSPCSPVLFKAGVVFLFQA